MQRQQESLRENQKRRTRADLLRAARKLMNAGGQPTVADVADSAGISRATAYRYFSTPDELLSEAILDVVAETIQVKDDPSAKATDVPARLQDLIGQVFDMVSDHDAAFRAFLATNLTTPGARRGGRRLSWIDTALRPTKADLPEDEYARLKNALAFLTGIETQIVLQDICGLERVEAKTTAFWIASALLQHTLQHSGKPDY